MEKIENINKNINGIDRATRSLRYLRNVLNKIKQYKSLSTSNKMKLKWHKFWLSWHYKSQCTMEDNATCGLHLLREISFEYRKVKCKVAQHLHRCEELDQGRVPK